MRRTLATARARITSGIMAELTDRAVIALTGPEARSLLQGLITNDVDKLAPEHPLYAALLTPQGKVLFDFLIFEQDGAVLLDCRRTARDALVKRLTMYKLRAKVTITPCDDLGVFADADNGLPDPRLPELGRRQIALRRGESSGTDAYHAQRLTLGVPEGDDFGSDRMFALDADLDELHGVSFDKGCYVGQELTARMKHRGKDRKRLLPIGCAGDSLPAAGIPVMAGAHEIGTITTAYGARGFALIRLDRLSEAGDTPLEANGVSVRITKPHWLFT